MIDIHSHILPGIDDGAVDIAESLSMIRAAVENGVDTIVATPHDRAIYPKQIDIDDHILNLKGQLKQSGNDVSILPGTEHQLLVSILTRAESGHLQGINGGRYLLVELPGGMRPPGFEQSLMSLQRLGYRVVLAHAERCPFIQRDISRARALSESDILLQVNASSLAGSVTPSSQRAARQLLTAGLVHVVASDAHGTADYAEDLPAAVRIVNRLLGPAVSDALLRTNPAAIIEDREELPPMPEVDSKRLTRLLPTALLGMSLHRRPSHRRTPAQRRSISPRDRRVK